MNFSTIGSTEDLIQLAEGKRQVAYILAKDRKTADDAALAWGWEIRLGQGYISHRGELVYYAFDLNALEGSRGVNIYIGRGWHRSPAGARLRTSAKWANNRGYTFITSVVHHTGYLWR